MVIGVLFPMGMVDQLQQNGPFSQSDQSRRDL